MPETAWRALLSVTMAQYRPTRRDQLLRHPVRMRIVEAIKSDPGISLSQLRSQLGCAWGTLHHHVRMLERQDLIASQSQGRSRHLFPTDLSSGAREGMALLRRGRVLELVKTVLEEPGLGQSQITGRLEISRKVLRAYMDQLVDHGFVDETREETRVSYRPTPMLATAIQRIDLQE